MSRGLLVQMLVDIASAAVSDTNQHSDFECPQLDRRSDAAILVHHRGHPRENASSSVDQFSASSIKVHGLKTEHSFGDSVCYSDDRGCCVASRQQVVNVI